MSLLNRLRKSIFGNIATTPTQHDQPPTMLDEVANLKLENSRPDYDVDMTFTPVHKATATKDGRLGGLTRPLADASFSAPQIMIKKPIISGRVIKSNKYLSPGDTCNVSILRGKSTRRNAFTEDLEYKASRDNDSDYDGGEDDVTTTAPDLHERAGTISPSKRSMSVKASKTAGTTFRKSPPRRKQDLRGGKAYRIQQDSNDEDDMDLAPQFVARLSAEQKAEEAARKKKADLRRSKIRSEHLASWHPDENTLFERFQMRGHEALMDYTWAWVFRTCPPVLFSFNENDCFLNCINTSSFRATTALQSLICLGGRIRALRDTDHPTTKTMKRELDAYIRWAERDGGYHKKRYIPLITTVAIERRHGSQKSKIITAEMQFLAGQYRRHLRLPDANGNYNDNEVSISTTMSNGVVGTDGSLRYARPPPLIYGILFMGLKGIVLTLDAGLGPAAEPRLLSVFDWNGTGMDVWNGLAMAMTVVSARNALVHQLERGELEDESEVEFEDVDA